MFSPAVVQRKLDSFEAKNGWRPRPHSIEECDKMTKHLNSDEVIVVTRTGTIELKRELTKGEVAWIRNERLMCAIDCAYYLTRYYMITSEERMAAAM